MTIEQMAEELMTLRALVRDIHRAVDRNALLITNDPELRDQAINVWERVKEVVRGA